MLLNFPKLGFSDSMSLSAGSIIIFSSIFRVLFNISTLTSSIYSSASSNITFEECVRAAALVCVVANTVESWFATVVVVGTVTVDWMGAFLEFSVVSVVVLGGAATENFTVAMRGAVCSWTKYIYQG